MSRAVGAITATVRSSSIPNLERVLPRRRFRLPELPGGSVPPLHAPRLKVRPTRPTLEPRNLIAQGRHHSLKLDELFPLLDNQAPQLGGRPAWEFYNHTDATGFAPLTDIRADPLGIPPI